MNTPADMKRPVLTMPPAEAQSLRLAYENAQVILEYGSGGSTVFGAEQAGKTLFSVESDAAWLANMRAYFDANPPAATLHMLHGDIGPTKAWAYPTDPKTFRSWPSYAAKIWFEPYFVQPEIVLIDGRFRAACFLATLFFTKAPVTVLFDDYKDRSYYHGVEDFVKPTAMHGRMAQFDLTPTPIPPEKLIWIMQCFLQPE